ncbi:unnamed protein product [Gadus morhua 'NCC']
MLAVYTLRSTASQLVRLLWGEDTAELQMALGHVPHVAMYLSLQLDSETLQEEPYLPPTGPVESRHPPKGPVESHLPPTGPVESRLPPTGPVESHLPPTGPVESHLPPTGPVESHLPPTGPVESRHPPTGPVESHLPPTGPVESRHPPTGPADMDIRHKGPVPVDWDLTGAADWDHLTGETHLCTMESMQHWKQPMVRLALVHQLTVLEQPARCHMVHHLTEDMHLTHHLTRASSKRSRISRRNCFLTAACLSLPSDLLLCTSQCQKSVAFGRHGKPPEGKKLLERKKVDGILTYVLRCATMPGWTKIDDSKLKKAFINKCRARAGENSSRPECTP